MGQLKVREPRIGLSTVGKCMPVCVYVNCLCQLSVASVAV